MSYFRTIDPCFPRNENASEIRNDYNSNVNILEARSNIAENMKENLATNVFEEMFFISVLLGRILAAY